MVRPARPEGRGALTGRRPRRGVVAGPDSGPHPGPGWQGGRSGRARLREAGTPPPALEVGPAVPRGPRLRRPAPPDPADPSLRGDVLPRHERPRGAAAGVAHRAQGGPRAVPVVPGRGAVLRRVRRAAARLSGGHLLPAVQRPARARAGDAGRGRPGAVGSGAESGTAAAGVFSSPTPPRGTSPMDRRDFLRDTLAAGAATGLLPAAPAASTARRRPGAI